MLNYIYGAGGHGKVVLDAMSTAAMSCAGFIDDKTIAEWFNLNVYRLSELELGEAVSFHLAIGNCKVRESIAQKLSVGHFFNVTHPMASIAQTATIGKGCFIASQSVLAPDSAIGNHCIVNHLSLIHI